MFFSRRKKKSESGISGQTSLKNRHPKVDIIEEDEVVDTFTKIENDVDSGVEDGEVCFFKASSLYNKGLSYRYLWCRISTHMGTRFVLASVTKVLSNMNI